MTSLVTGFWARAARVEHPGAFYDVLTRGNQRQKIFYDDRDRKKYLSLLRSLKKAYAFRIHAYVLMLNHVHLFLEAGDVPLSRFMQRLGSSYTQYFNRRHRLAGHLFHWQRILKSRLINNDPAFLLVLH